MKLGSKYDLLNTPHNLKRKQIYWSTYLQSVEKIQRKLQEELVSHTMQYQTIIFSEQLSKLSMLKNPVNLSKNIFFSIALLQAYLQYVCNISTTCWKDPMKALTGVDFTKYALSTIIY